jgi:dihydrodipicolinate synthase/N-acetylneuraminate lyase
MTAATLEGIVPILVMPFDDEGRIDHESLRNLIEFNVAAGIHGLGVALGSEIFKLTQEERADVVATVVRAVAKRVPVVINTGANGTDLCIAQSRHAEAAGADALMIMPPSFMPISAEEIFEHYRAVAAAVAVPIILQDIPQAPVPPGLALRIADVCPNVRTIKVETMPVAGKVADMTAAAGSRLTVFGGAGGVYFIEELRRGARGTMPFCSQPGAFLEVWNLFQAGDQAGARRVFDAAFTGINRLGSQGGDLFYHVQKQLLVRMGIIRTAHVRRPTSRIDPITQQEIDTVLEALVPVARRFGAPVM